MKKFIITIDTEGDNLWKWKLGDAITTENVKYLPRFQNLCNDFGFKPVWLTNYEIIRDLRYLELIAKIEQEKNGELGMHLHAWNTPPAYELDIVQNGAPYLIEYPIEVMEEKIAVMTDAIKSIGITPISHRAGRWAMNEKYFELLAKYGYCVDCSVTPHINWVNSKGATKNAKGVDYSDFSENPYWINTDSGKILEMPVSIRKTHKFMLDNTLSAREILRGAYRAIKGNVVWLRPNGKNLNSMIKLAEMIAKSQSDYIMFMLHSSELMPGGSPTFKTENDIENLYIILKDLFKYCSKYFEGMTLRDYYSNILKRIAEAK